MKFAEHLSAHITPEWQKQYIQYDKMKEILYAERIKCVTPELFDEFEQTFFQFCIEEVEKINSFYEERLAESSRKLVDLKTQLRLIKSAPAVSSQRQLEKQKHNLRLAFSEVYLGLILIQNYQTLNFTGFCKIQKKHDKLFSTSNGQEWISKKVKYKNFARDSYKPGSLISEIEEIFTNDLENGDRSRAMKKLRVPPISREFKPTFMLGFLAGALVLIFIKIMLSAAEHTEDYDWKTLIRLYRGPFLLNIFIFLIGLNIYAWRAHGVNHVLIFEIDPRNHLSPQNHLEIALFLNCIWGLSLLCFFRAKDLGIEIYSSPLALLIFYVAFLLNPTNSFWYSGRIWLLKKLLRILTAPFHRVTFADFWLADQLSSLLQVMLDFQFFICIYLYWDTLHGMDIISSENCAQFCHCNSPRFYIRPIIRCIPAWIRLVQCLRRYYDSKKSNPHLYNAGKYGCSFFVVIFSTLYAHLDADKSNNPAFTLAALFLWISSGIISSFYSYIWDIKMDWGLWDLKQTENRFLREEIVYHKKVYYYLAIVEDLILRFSWAVQLSLTETGFLSSEIVVTCLAPLELFRRFIWNFFRLENEHLNNCGDFRAIRDISVLPVKDQRKLLRTSSDLATPSPDLDADVNENVFFPTKPTSLGILIDR